MPGNARGFPVPQPSVRYMYYKVSMYMYMKSRRTQYLESDSAPARLHARLRRGSGPAGRGRRSPRLACRQRWHGPSVSSQVIARRVRAQARAACALAGSLRKTSSRHIIITRAFRARASIDHAATSRGPWLVACRPRDGGGGCGCGRLLACTARASAAGGSWGTSARRAGECTPRRRQQNPSAGWEEGGARARGAVWRGRAACAAAVLPTWLAATASQPAPRDDTSGSCS